MIVDLACDCCDAPMTMEKLDSSTIGPQTMFSCTKCKQQHWFGAMGHQCLILARLYPSNMNERSAIFREFLEYRRAEVKFEAKAMALAGLISNTECVFRFHNIDVQIANKLEEIKGLRRWWQFWRTGT